MAAGAALPPVFDDYAQETIPAAAAGSAGKSGELEAVFATDRQGNTRLVFDRACVPLHLSGALDHDEELPDLASVYVQSPTGGIAQGDRHHTSVRVEAGARAHVSTQSATKVLGMERNFGRSDVRLAVGAGGYLEYLPEPTILYGDARFCQCVEAEVAPDATLVLSDVVVPGRLARDESFDYERYFGAVEVVDPEGTQFADAVHLGPDAPTAGPGILGEYAVLGTLYVVAPVDAGALADSIDDRLHRGAGRAAVSTLPRDRGAVVRALGHRTDDVTRALDGAWDAVRRELFDAGAPVERKC